MERSQVLILSLLVAIFDEGVCLTCYCKNSRLCNGNEDVCSGTNDVCFAKILENGTYEYGCLEATGNSPFSSVLRTKCLNNSEGFQGLWCCNDGNRCNEDLRQTTGQLSTHPPSPTAIDSVAEHERGGDRYQIYINLTIAFSILAVILLAVIIIAFVSMYCWHRKRSAILHSSILSSEVPTMLEL